MRRANESRNDLGRLLILPALLLVYSQPAKAAELVRERFEYDAGDVIEFVVPTGLNLTGVYTTTAPLADARIRDPGLDFGTLSGALPATAGFSLATTGTVGTTIDISIDQPVAVPLDEPIFVTALMTLDDSTVGAMNLLNLFGSNPGDVIRFGNDIVGGANAVRLQAVGPGGAHSQVAPAAFSNGDTILFILRYTNGATAGSDSALLVGYNIADGDLVSFDLDPDFGVRMSSGAFFERVSRCK